MSSELQEFLETNDWELLNQWSEQDNNNYFKEKLITMNLNKCFLLGRTTADVELKKTPSGQSVSTFSLATSRQWKDSAGNKQESATFHRVVAWGKTAEIASSYLKKGNLVLIEGRIENRNYEDKQGNKKSISEVIAENLQLAPRTDTQPKPKVEEEIPVIDETENLDIKDIHF